MVAISKQKEISTPLPFFNAPDQPARFKEKPLAVGHIGPARRTLKLVISVRDSAKRDAGGSSSI
jgi:hypothetical protein